MNNSQKLNNLSHIRIIVTFSTKTTVFQLECSKVLSVASKFPFDQLPLHKNTLINFHVKYLTFQLTTSGNYFHRII